MLEIKKKFDFFLSVCLNNKKNYKISCMYIIGSIYNVITVLSNQSDNLAEKFVLIWYRPIYKLFQNNEKNSFKLVFKIDLKIFFRSM